MDDIMIRFRKPYEKKNKEYWERVMKKKEKKVVQ